MLSVMHFIEYHLARLLAFTLFVMCQSCISYDISWGSMGRVTTSSDLKFEVIAQWTAFKV